MSENKIEVGDKVRVDFTPLDDVRQPYFYGEVLDIPQDTGDMWKFKLDGDLIYVNPSSSRLETITRIKSTPSTTERGSR